MLGPALGKELEPELGRVLGDELGLELGSKGGRWDLRSGQSSDQS